MTTGQGMEGFHDVAPTTPVASHVVGYRTWSLGDHDAAPDPSGPASPRDSFWPTASFPFERGTLSGMTHRECTWGADVNTAVCARKRPTWLILGTTAPSDIVRDVWELYDREHDASSPPIQSCGCGFWAYTSDHYNPSTTWVWGVIHGWGRIIAGPKGFRCQHARIVALYLRDDPLNPGTLERRVNAVRIRYPNVEIFDDARLMMDTYPATDLTPLLPADEVPF